MSRSGQQRLQRTADFTGRPLNSFKDVFLRHGLPGLLLGLLFLWMPGASLMLRNSLASGTSDPVFYLAAMMSLLLGCFGYSWFLNKRWVIGHLGWILYLGLLCVWEEWFFRLALPQSLESMGLGAMAAILVSNMAFGAAHYFTLRWRWQWCVGAFLGGLMFSRQMELHGDLLLVIGIHWLATFLNTPRPPGGSVTKKS